MSYHTVFDDTGRAVAIKKLNALRLRPGEVALDGRWDAKVWYWPDGEIEPIARPVMPCSLDKTQINADGVDVATLSGVQEGAEIRFGSQRTTADVDGIIELTADAPANLRLLVRLWPYKDWEAEIEAS